MNFGNSKIRMFLIETGFSVPLDARCNGVSYVLCYDNDFVISANLAECKMFAEMPDFEYNKTNRMSPKTRKLNFHWLPSEDVDLSIHNIKKFIDRVCEIYEKKGDI